MTESEVFLLLLSRLLLLQSSQYQPLVSTTVLLLNQSGGFNVDVCEEICVFVCVSVPFDSHQQPAACVLKRL